MCADFEGLGVSLSFLAAEIPCISTLRDEKSTKGTGSGGSLKWDDSDGRCYTLLAALN